VGGDLFGEGGGAGVDVGALGGGGLLTGLVGGKLEERGADAPLAAEGQRLPLYRLRRGQAGLLAILAYGGFDRLLFGFEHGLFRLARVSAVAALGL
jgi:hypothetical protein